ncbi:bidirectional hydrogenase complex protein HoxU [uncultured Paludibaculum sp.]|uniref:bidirectional hydrogenase complex protein HoxU n=1 Tax=uncultured Paludibaculum sp. TaxID=1765020 RepID=UPI002AAB905B|nr:bidirectional hydrogenase complex protein HoxU [uncultured Paludibaculum sp.]
MPQKISLRIDGELIHTAAGQSILDAAKAHNKFIPSLCHMKGLSSVGACRLCIVEVAGVGRLLPACTTPVQDGMSVTTQSDKLRRYRRIALELLFAERNHVCAVCVSNGFCELQGLAKRLGVTNIRYPYTYPKVPIDLTHPRYTSDQNRCILCSRCVRVCAEVEGAHVWEISGRGVGSRLVCELNRSWGESTNCTSCGKCVQSCPTGAIAEKGFAVEEMSKRTDPISRLATLRAAGADNKPGVIL